MNTTFAELYREMSAEERADLARRTGTHAGYLYQIATGRRRAGASVIERLMRADARISFDMMRGAVDGAVPDATDSGEAA